MTEDLQERWVTPLRDLLSSVTGRHDGTGTKRGGYFCRTCGTTMDAHQATCPNCGSYMLEPADRSTGRSN